MNTHAMQEKDISALGHKLLAILQKHIGKRFGITAIALGVRLGLQDRQVRRLITELRDAGTAICGTPRDGYYIAETAEELEATCQFLRGRALHSLTLESRLRKIPMPELLGQMRLKT